jgi:hypothetical protein
MQTRQSVASGNYIVPDRECGSCTACCKELAILEDGMSKLPGVLCEHCTVAKGCNIYDARPNICRTYHCLWRSLPEMGEAWRPDRSDVLMIPAAVPPQFKGDFAVELILIKGPNVLQTDAFAGMVAGFIESGTAAFLDVPRGVGMLSQSLFLNALLAPVIAARDLAGLKAMLWNMYEAIMERPPTPIPSTLSRPS